MKIEGRIRVTTNAAFRTKTRSELGTGATGLRRFDKAYPNVEHANVGCVSSWQQAPCVPPWPRVHPDHEEPRAFVRSGSQIADHGSRIMNRHATVQLPFFDRRDYDPAPGAW